MFVVAAVVHAAGERAALVDRAASARAVEEPARTVIRGVVEQIPDDLARAAEVAENRAAFRDPRLAECVARRRLDQERLAAAAAAAGRADRAADFEAGLALSRVVFAILIELVIIETHLPRIAPGARPRTSAYAAV